MDYLPIFLALKDQVALVVGGGAVASRKIALLRAAGSRIRVVAPDLCDELATSGAVLDHRARGFRPEDLDGVALAIAATDDRAVNQAVADAARSRHLPVNVVDDPALCSFIMPAIIDRGRVVAAVSTGGVSPVLARMVRTRLELALPASLERAADQAAQWREAVRLRLPDITERRRFWEEVLPRLLAGEDLALDALLDGNAVIGGSVTVIAVDPADPDAITLGDLKRLQAADRILYQAGVPDALLDYARRDATRQMIDTPEPVDPGGETVVVLVRR